MEPSYVAVYPFVPKPSSSKIMRTLFALQLHSSPIRLGNSFKDVRYPTQFPGKIEAFMKWTIDCAGLYVESVPLCELMIKPTRLTIPKNFKLIFEASIRLIYYNLGL